MTKPDRTDLTAFEIEQAFLAWIDRWHAAHGYELDHDLLFDLLQVQVRPSQQSFYDPYYKRIHLQRDQHFNRVRHEALHELAHLLFNEAEEGAFIAALNCLTSDPGLRLHLEESAARQAGVRLALPEHLLRHSITATDSLVAATAHLAKTCNVSFGLAVRRVMQAQERSMRGMIIDGAGNVVDGFGYGKTWMVKYAPGAGHTVPAHHELRQARKLDQTNRMKCAIPYSESARREVWDTEAYYDSRRHQTIALFFKFKHVKTGMQSLFDVS